jgi:hypothetical protein
MVGKLVTYVGSTLTFQIEEVLGNLFRGRGSDGNLYYLLAERVIA